MIRRGHLDVSSEAFGESLFGKMKPEENNKRRACHG